MIRSVIIDKDLWVRDSERFWNLETLARSNLWGLSGYYPGFAQWYSEKVISGLLSGERKILLRESSGELAAIAIIKQAENEKKLCCLRVMPSFQGTGIGLKMFKEAFEILETDRPLLTVAEEQLPKFQRIFDHFNFEVGSRYPDFYRINKIEYSFNGLMLVPVG